MQNLKLALAEHGFDNTKVSKEEGYFYDWLLELKAKGYIHAIELQPSYDLTDSISHDFVKLEMKGRGENRKLTRIHKDYKIMNGMKYTPDFDVIWTPKARGKFVFVEGDVLESTFTNARKRMFYGQKTESELATTSAAKSVEGDYVYTCLEVKGSFTSKNNSTDVKFPLLMKMMYEVYQIYVNKLMPLHKTKGTFACTFTPQTYWLTEKTKVERKTAWTKLSSKQYIELLEDQ